MTPFGPVWNELALSDLETFVQTAPAEPLYWEGKGELRADSVRKQVCGFGNSHDVGYLLLGARRQGENWTLDGVEFPITTRRTPSQTSLPAP